MNVIKTWMGQEAINFYKKEFQSEPPENMDHIEIVELKDNLNAIFVYEREVKEVKKAA